MQPEHAFGAGTHPVSGRDMVIALAPAGGETDGPAAVSPRETVQTLHHTGESESKSPLRLSS